jgi:hypothetical protein
MLTRRNEIILVAVLAALAAVRVAVFITLPIFGPTDETQHFDDVIRYSRGDIPRAIGPCSRELFEWTPVFINPDYWFDPERTTIPKTDVESYNASVIRAVLDGQVPTPPNHELLEPPLYYIVAGAWLRVGEVFGMRGFELVYWVRALHIVITAAIVLIGYSAAAAVFPGNALVRLGTAALLATWPQDALYAVTNDALVPVCAGVAFLGLTKWSTGGWNPTRAAAVVAASLAATLLTKVTAAPIVAVMVVAALCLALSDWRTFIPLTVAGLVVALWLCWNKMTFGYWTGSMPKLQSFDFSVKPIGRWGESTLWTWRGAKDYWSELIANFWRGEMIWHGKQIGAKLMDRVYLFATVAVILTAALSLLRNPSASQWTAVSIGAWGFLGSAMYLVVATFTIDFGPKGTPSPYYSFPGFVNARLMDGVMIPFAVMFAYGLSALRWRWLSWTLLIAYCGAMTLSEIWLHIPTFRESW